MKVDTFTTVTIVSSGMQRQQKDPEGIFAQLRAMSGCSEQVRRRGRRPLPVFFKLGALFYEERFSHKDYKTSPYNSVAAAEAAAAAAALIMSPSHKSASHSQPASNM